MKVLSEAYVAHNISVEMVDQLVGNIFANNLIVFSVDEIPSGGHGNIKAFYITINCKGYTLPRAFLDNGSSVNIIPMTTLSRFPSHGYEAFLQLLARATFDPHGWSNTFYPSSKGQVYGGRATYQLLHRHE